MSVSCCQGLPVASFRSMPNLLGARNSLGCYTLPSGSCSPKLINEDTRWDNLELLFTFQSFLWDQAEAGLQLNLHLCLTSSPAFALIPSQVLLENIHSMNHLRISNSDSAFREGNLRQLAGLSDKDAATPKASIESRSWSYLLLGP